VSQLGHNFIRMPPNSVSAIPPADGRGLNRPRLKLGIALHHCKRVATFPALERVPIAG
jgi:hypothetical protein